MPGIPRVHGRRAGRNSVTGYNGTGRAVATIRMKTDDINDQTIASLSRIDENLAGMGRDRTGILNATIYIADIAMRGEMDGAWTAWIGGDPAHWPQPAWLQSGLARHLIEITVIAAV
ncbi:Rid family hydrolase [Salipiger aestuarii]|uniref:Endoribonuclease L-PSP n=1 Tax=Salipiger aestuarii TaxID=568098 RepID=A0A327YD90_9RHOB|nr:Rid family hydrolase [Salipiger aestuarii]EIE52751.1 hypothetical protein C357_01959 [Citreicella sp. 357]RAK19030.1 endoribonuclease L-PSP [Salipiger aestuarii]